MTNYERHPLNTDFEWPNQAKTGTFLSQQQIDDWNNHGFFLLKDAIDPQTLKEVEKAIDPIEAEYEAKLKEQGGQFGISKADALTFTTHLVLKDPILKRFATESAFVELCASLIGPDARLYWDQAVYKKPGNPDEFPWHQDNGYSFVEPQTYLTCWVPLSQATIDNGCPWVLPGLHKQGTLEHKLTRLGFQCVDDPIDAIAVPAEVGDVVVFSSLTPHRTGPNLSTEIRKAYILQYCHGHSEVVTPKGERLVQADKDRQFYVLQNGEPCSV